MTALVVVLAMGIGIALRQILAHRAKPVPPVRSIAVLPLVNLTHDPEQEYFADGMTEALTSDLSQISKLRVISRTSAMTYKGSGKPVRAIAKDLNVDTVVEGSVLRSGQRVRIVAQLIDSASDTHLWSGTYERELRDVLRLQSEIAQAVAHEIRIALNSAEAARLSGRPAVKPEAYEAYLKGMFHLNKFTPEGFDRGMAYLQKAIETDPTDRFAHAALALGFAMVGHDRSPGDLNRAKAAAQKSLLLGGPLAEAYAALGMEEMYSDWDLASGGRDLQRALKLNPNFAEARRNYSWWLRIQGQREAGLAEMRRAEALDPLSPQISADLAWQHLFEGLYDASMAEAQKSLELNPSFSQGLAIVGWVYAERGLWKEALTAQRKAAAEDTAWKWPLGRTYALMGRRAEARSSAAEIERHPGPMDQWGLAAIYAALGDKDRAFRCLEEAYQSRFSWMPWIGGFAVPSQDVFASLRRDPRFHDLTRRIGLPRPGSP